MLSAKWYEQRKYLDLLLYCKTLKRKHQKTKEDICIEHFGGDGTKALRDTGTLLMTAYYQILNDMCKVFGPVPCATRKCANPHCGIELEPWPLLYKALEKCPRCKSTEWLSSGKRTFWYITTTPLEAWHVTKRYGVNIEGNARRYVGSDDYPKIKQNLEKCLGMPIRDLLSGVSTVQAAKELMAPLVTCPKCQAQFHASNAKLCCCCGAKLP